MTGEHMHNFVLTAGEVVHLLNVYADRVTGLKRGANEYLIRPASPSKVINVVDDLMVLSPVRVESARLEKHVGY